MSEKIISNGPEKKVVPKEALLTFLQRQVKELAPSSDSGSEQAAALAVGRLRNWVEDTSPLGPNFRNTLTTELGRFWNDVSRLSQQTGELPTILSSLATDKDSAPKMNLASFSNKVKGAFDSYGALEELLGGTFKAAMKIEDQKEYLKSLSMQTLIIANILFGYKMDDEVAGVPGSTLVFDSFVRRELSKAPRRDLEELFTGFEGVSVQKLASSMKQDELVVLTQMSCDGIASTLTKTELASAMNDLTSLHIYRDGREELISHLFDIAIGRKTEFLTRKVSETANSWIKKKESDTSDTSTAATMNYVIPNIITRVANESFLIGRQEFHDL